MLVHVHPKAMQNNRKTQRHEFSQVFGLSTTVDLLIMVDDEANIGKCLKSDHH